MSSDPINLTPNDIVGMVQRGLMELNGYLSQVPPLQVDTNQVSAHLDRMLGFVHTLQDMQLQHATQEHAANGNGKEARN